MVLDPSIAAVLLLACLFGVARQGAEVAAAMAVRMQWEFGDLDLPEGGGPSGFDHLSICSALKQQHNTIGSRSGKGVPERYAFQTAQRSLMVR